MVGVREIEGSTPTAGVRVGANDRLAAGETKAEGARDGALVEVGVAVRVGVGVFVGGKAVRKARYTSVSSATMVRSAIAALVRS